MKKNIFLILVLVLSIQGKAYSGTMDILWVNPDPTSYIIQVPTTYISPYACNNGPDAAGSGACDTGKSFLGVQYFLQAIWKIHNSTHWQEVFFVSNDSQHTINCGVTFDYGSPDQYPGGSTKRCNLIRDENAVYIFPVGTTPYRITDDQFYNLLKYDKRF